MDPKMSCVSCFSHSVSLFYIENKELQFTNNNNLISFSECYKFCTRHDDIKPLTKICQICARQFQRIYKQRNKTTRSLDLNIKIKTEEQHVEDIFVESPKSVVRVQDEAKYQQDTMFPQDNSLLAVVQTSDDDFPNVELNLHLVQELPTKRKKNRKKAINRYFCHHCTRGALTPSAILKHLNRKHFGVKYVLEKTHLCSQCGRAFQSKANLQSHSLVHQKHIRPFQCTICSKGYGRKCGLDCHMRRRHSEDTSSLICQLCPNRANFSTQRRFDDHQKLHSPQSACECLQCAQAFASFNDLLCHTYERHQPALNSLDVKCTTCKKTFVTPAGLRHHLFGTHFNHKYECPICGKKFTQQPPLKDHMWVHNAKYQYPFWCQEKTCSFRTRTKSLFVMHLSNVHKIVYESVIHDLNEEEILKMMEEKQEIIAKTSENDTTEKKFKCEQCDATFKSRNYVYMHRSRVHNKKLVHCRHLGCGSKPFKNEELLWQHSFEHLGYFPFICQECNYKTAAKKSFQTHLLKFHKITFDEAAHGYVNPN